MTKLLPILTTWVQLRSRFSDRSDIKVSPAINNFSINIRAIRGQAVLAVFWA